MTEAVKNDINSKYLEFVQEYFEILGAPIEDSSSFRHAKDADIGVCLTDRTMEESKLCLINVVGTVHYATTRKNFVMDFEEYQKLCDSFDRHKAAIFSKSYTLTHWVALVNFKDFVDPLKFCLLEDLINPMKFQSQKYLPKRHGFHFNWRNPRLFKNDNSCLPKLTDSQELQLFEVYKARLTEVINLTKEGAIN
jgi:hypothetical protein